MKVEVTKMKQNVNIKNYVRQPITAVQAKTYHLIMSFKPLTAYDYKRLVAVIRLYNRSVIIYSQTGKENSGVYGCAVELFGHRPTSTLTRVRPKGECDNYVLVDDKPCKMETKTNGGQIQDFFKMSNREIDATYIHYNLNINVRPSKKNPSGIRQLDFICTLRHFLNRLEEVNAYKENGANLYGAIINIQSDSAKMYKLFMKDIENMTVLPFNRQMVYCKEDFE